ncbi:Tail-specific protease precursor [Novipirellula galeiformis]|uniref:Tail-specific protease n=1 Tax=Novipirellula galeiformis TaxID=2528004 RepID=A0A5C6CL18_9BACT|nr:carboxy terminal-processing peptidase [Novipirellula galeiformis]TWU24247.1 Tail-specific protease precursor [Novipirellula galeiformis]
MDCRFSTAYRTVSGFSALSESSVDAHHPRRAKHTPRFSTWLKSCSALLVVVLAAEVSFAQAVTEAPAVQAIKEGAATVNLGPLKLATPTPKDSMVARLIATLMPRNHISSQRLNDTISQRSLNLFLKSLDPMKLYFLQSDIDQFQRNALRIDDMVQAGDLSFAYEVFGRFIERVDQRVTVALELLDGEFDFEKDEQIIIDPEATTYAKDATESQDRWRRQIKYALLDLKDEGKEGDEARDLLRRRYLRYDRRWRDTNSDALLEMYLTSVTTAYDPHSTYMSPNSLDEFDMIMRLSLDGIGAQLREKDGNTVVSRVIPGGAAAKHGKLKPDDVIVSVGQDAEGPMVDIVEMPLNDVVGLIRGKAGSIVRLGVRPGGAGNVEIHQIVRARIELDESAARGKVIEHQIPGAPEQTRKIGYITLPSFYMDMEGAKNNKRDFRSSTRDVLRIIDDFKAQGIDGIVLDLSTNGGGSLTEAINLTGLFIDRGPVVQVKNADGSVQQYDDEDRGTAWDGPLVVMTSKFSASASEIFAGAIKDYHRGIVVGDPTSHGKGTVQTLMDLGQQLFRNNRENYGALKVTLQQFYLPDGESTQLAGVAADIVLPSITAKMDVAEGDLKFALPNDRVKPAKHDNYNMVPADLIGQLRSDSMGRIAQDKEFTELLQRIELYVRQKEQASISLKEDEFMARRKELDAQKEEEEKELEAEVGAQEIYRDYFYNREVLNIAHQYIDGLKKQNLAVAR